MRRLVLALGLFLAAPLPGLAVEPETLDESVLEHLRTREEDLLNRVRSFDPNRYDQLLSLKDRDPRAYAMALLRVARMVDRAPAPQSPELREQLRQLEEIKQGMGVVADLNAKQLKEARAKIQAIAERIFTIRQAQRREQIARLREALSDLEEDVKRRDREHDQLIERFVDEVVHGRADL